jgi:adhesin transport system membrane fusion protein
MVRPQDIAWVRMGQKAKVNITAYDSSIYGSLEGLVTAISPDATLNEKTGESFYTVQVRTTKNALVSKRGQRLPIGTGMVADVSLLGDKRTILNYILSPITKLNQTAFRE